MTAWMAEDCSGHEGWVARVLPDGRIARGSTVVRAADGTVTFYEWVADTAGEEWVPSAAVTGWRAHCDCGWEGARL